jgi:SAM-dependent methyltransferase
LGRVLDFVIGIESTAQHFVQPSGDPRMNRYQASYWLSVVVGLRGIRIGREDVFVDFGCGKGRALYLACWYPFRQVIGVELDPQMASVARRNMARARGPRSLRTVQILDGDARFVELPDNLRVAFFFNPFHGAVFRTVTVRLKNHADKRQSPLRVIYANPTESGTLLELGFVVVRESAHCSVFDYHSGSAC